MNTLPNCPSCKGQTELNSHGGISCFFCGYDSGAAMPAAENKTLHIMEKLPTVILANGKNVLKKS
jgi:hypothetical protein